MEPRLCPTTMKILLRHFACFVGYFFGGNYGTRSAQQTERVRAWNVRPYAPERSYEALSVVRSIWYDKPVHSPF